MVDSSMDPPADAPKDWEDLLMTHAKPYDMHEDNLWKACLRPLATLHAAGAIPVQDCIRDTAENFAQRRIYSSYSPIPIVISREREHYQIDADVENSDVPADLVAFVYTNEELETAFRQREPA